MRGRFRAVWDDGPHRAPTMLVMALGCAAVLWGGWSAWETAGFLRHAARATGVVADPRQHQTVRFTTADGVVVTFVQNGHLSLPQGAEVPVAYDARDPVGTARAGTAEALWYDPAAAFLSGLGAVVLPLFGLRAAWNPRSWTWRRRDVRRT